MLSKKNLACLLSGSVSAKALWISLAPISTSQVGIFNVTFEPGCRNNWHIHHAKSGGGQILVCVAGRGYYQVEGKEAVEMKPGDCINIPAEVKHWHGAASDEWFSHLAIEVPGENSSNEWLELRRVSIFIRFSPRSIRETDAVPIPTFSASPRQEIPW